MTKSTGMPAQSIDQIVEYLDGIVQRSREEQSRLGFFAVLYRKVTVAIKEGITSGRFEDGPRMEHFDVVFANRYLAALEHFRQGQPTNDCWTVAFRSVLAERCRTQTILLSTHVLSEVQRICSRVLILEEGKTLYDGKGSADLEEMYMNLLKSSPPEVPDKGATPTGEVEP